MKKKKIRKILIVRPDSIGDYILFSGFLKYIREAYRDYFISILLQEHVAELARDCPYIDEITPFNRQKFITERVYTQEVMRNLRSKKYSVVLYPVYSRDVVGDFITLECGAPVAITFKGDNSNMNQSMRLQNNKYYTRCIRVRKDILNEFERNKIFAKTLVKKSGQLTESQPYIVWSEEENIFVEHLLGEYNITEPFIALAPFSQYSIRKWPIERWVSLISAYHSFPIVICGMQSDKKEAQCIIENSDHVRVINFCGNTTLRQCASLLTRAKVLIGVETALCHMAASVGTPSVVITGGGHFGRFLPYNELHHIVYKKMSCYGCNWQCKHMMPYCLTDIRVEQVVRVLQKIGITSSKRIFGKKNHCVQYYLFGSLHKTCGKEKKAERWFKQAITEHDGKEIVGGAYFHLGEMLLERRRRKEAKDYFTECLEYIPDHKKARQRLKAIKAV
ncbi:MAG: hypothetical protein KKH94_07770 [Candidatus Omnitrophica bacterium]|nr:hypothetical protein [Candidatus Omnitrophota bacterium]